MDGRSVSDRLDSTPAGWFDRPTDRPDNKQTSRQSNHAPTIHPTNPTDISKQNNQPPDWLAINPTTDIPSIRQTANQPTNQAQFLQAIIA